MSALPDSLFLQTALSRTFAALFHEQTCVDQIDTYLDFKSDNTYVADISTLLNRNLLKPSDLKRFYLLAGPGYFTGIRAGIVIAKGFCDVGALKVGLLSSFDYLRACIPGSQDLAVVIATSRKEGYIAYFEGTHKTTEALIPLSELESLGKKWDLFSETPFIQDLYGVKPIDPLPLLPGAVQWTNTSEGILPHYLRGELDLFRTPL